MTEKNNLNQLIEFIENYVPEEYLDLLKNPNLFNLITELEFEKKIVGEIETRKTIFLCAQGRLVENHQISSYNLLINDEAGAGKDYVVNADLDILPKEVYVHKTRISPTVFTYWHNSNIEPNWTWDGKVFYPEDISDQVLNSDVFKVMTSQGSSATITIKNQAVDIQIKGKPVVITTTASATPSQEITRRFAFINLDTSEEQTRAILRRYSNFRKDGIIPEYDPCYTEAMKYLKRVKVKIPFANRIDQYFPAKNVMMRTNYPRFLDFISASAAFHQFQREKDNSGFILAQKEDYDIARICFLKACSNRYMIPLTINQKKILTIFENEPTLKGNANLLHMEKMTFLSLPALQTNLGILVKYGLIEVSLTRDSWNREIECYQLSHNYNPNERVNIPLFDDIMIDDLTPLTPETPVSKDDSVKDVKDIKGESDNTFRLDLEQEDTQSKASLTPETPVTSKERCKKKEIFTTGGSLTEKWIL